MVKHNKQSHKLRNLILFGEIWFLDQLHWYTLIECAFDPNNKT